jgi:hypothetical protein
MRSALVLALVAAAAISVVGCNTYSQNLARSREAFEQNQHERALAILRALEPDENHLTENEQAEYAYLRGMTDYRIGYHSDARHWLAGARELEKSNPKALTDDWKARLGQVLDELNTRVYAEGVMALSNAPAAKGDAAEVEDKPEPKKGAKKKPDAKGDKGGDTKGEDKPAKSPDAKPDK